MRALSGFTIAKKLILLTLLTGVGISGVAAAFMATEHNLLTDERARAVRQAVEVASAVIEHDQALVAAGAATEVEAKRHAMETLRFLRYDGREYFWINDLEPRMIMHPVSSQLEGKDLNPIADPEGKHPFVEMAKIARDSGSGFVSYMWPKPGSTEPVAKISYIKRIPGWDWVVGSGVYTDSVEAVFAQRAIEFCGAALTLSALLMLVGHVISTSIRRPLEVAVAAAERVAAGDLTGVISTEGSDEAAQVLKALQKMNANLAKIVGTVDTGLSTVASSSTQIASGNQDLSARTEQQASALEETAATMEQLTGAVQNNAANARHASDLATAAAGAATKGGQIVGEVVQTMKDIHDSAQQIGNIIGLIDNIAFQTNILSLNAAVEAAHAGDRGRGFAVVASEVRNLAHRSAAAAKDVRALIDKSVQRIDAGSALADQAGVSMNEIVESARRVNSLIADIASASEEQQAGIKQVNQAIAEMDGTTQQNAALVEELAATADSMSQQAQSMYQAFSAFKVHGKQNGRPDSGD